uniref:recombinase family protein n=2 Tax=Yoonia sp. TaxID=2212373 RepID=UPI004047CED3
MKTTLIGYARCSTDKQDLSAQKQALLELGVSENLIYTDYGLTGTNRQRPGLDQAIAAVREGDTLVVPKLDRLARSVPDARAIAEQLEVKGVKLALGASVYDPTEGSGPPFASVQTHACPARTTGGDRLRDHLRGGVKRKVGIPAGHGLTPVVQPCMKVAGNRGSFFACLAPND